MPLSEEQRMNTTVLLIAGVYFIVSLSVGLWVGRKEKNVADDYFLAGRKLPWYAVALSMTGSNIGTEHFIGMVGTAYAFGLARSHPFVDGNKRTAYVVCRTFLKFNGLDVEATNEDKFITFLRLWPRV